MSLIDTLRKNSSRADVKIKERQDYFNSLNSDIIENIIKEQFKLDEEDLKNVSNYVGGHTANWSHKINFIIPSDKLQTDGYAYNVLPTIESTVRKFFTDEGFFIVDYMLDYDDKDYLAKVTFSWSY